ncbi:hypothetical protein [Vibrio coralliilyticus]|uniref:hypothetical protein n=1 Tax=Vibrio coralliilyticus TaxID=190893 RepID=UPI0002E0484B|nr:hypothetical protein [Vibrio coralliilyticus]
MLSSHLFHFAMVHEKFAQSGDIVTGLLPLFSPILEGKEGLEFDAITFCSDVRKMYGIEMHPYVAEDLSEKLVENGVLAIEKKGRSEKLIIETVPVVQDKDLKASVQNILEAYEAYSQPILHKNDLTDSSINFSSAFTSRLARVDSFAEVAPSSDKSIEGILDYTFIRFVEYINRKGGQLKISLDKLYSGSLLSEVVLSIQEPSMDDKSIDGKLFYIDMPILLNVLGLNDEYSVECSRKLIALIRQLGGIVTTTNQYIEEAETALSLSLENHRNRGKRVTTLDRYLFKHSDHVLEARLVRNKVMDTLINNHGFVLDNAKVNVSGHLQSVKAGELRDSIASSLHWYKKDIARVNDAEAVAYVVVRHGFNSIKNVAESTAFLVTPNEQLVSAANNVLYEIETFKTHEMTPLLTEKKLAMMLWVTSGGKGEDVSSLTLISSCTRAMEMHKDISESMQRFIKALPQEKVQQYEDVICNDRALYCLLDEVGFDVNEAQLDDAEDYLKKARDRYYQEQKDIKTTHQATIEDAKLTAEVAIEHRNKAIEAVKIKANENLIRDKENAALQGSLQALNEQIEYEKRNQEKLDKTNEGLERRLTELENAKKEDDEANSKRINELEKKAVQSKLDTKARIGNRLYHVVKKSLEFLIIFILIIILYNLSKLAPDASITTEYFTLEPELLSLLPLICTWKFPDFIFGPIVKSLASGIVRLILKDEKLQLS